MTSGDGRRRRVRAPEQQRRWYRGQLARKEPCDVKGCERYELTTRISDGRRFCTMHYKRWLKYRDPGEPEPRCRPNPRVCTVPGCERGSPMCKGYCTMHYRRWSKWGDPGPAELLVGPHRRCTVREGKLRCNAPHHCRGMCERHYAFWHRTGHHGPVIPRYRKFKCKIDKCTRPHHARGMCKNHWQQWYREGRKQPRPPYRWYCATCGSLSRAVGKPPHHLRTTPARRGYITPHGPVPPRGKQTVRCGPFKKLSSREEKTA